MVLDEKQQQQQNGGIVGDDPYAAAMRSSKKNKNKKIPQRGLGVAQLEKLRLEEQQKNAAASSSSSDPSAQGLGLPPQPYIPLPSAESVLRPRVPYNILYRPPPIHPSSSVADLLGSAQQPAEASNDEQPGFLPMLCIDPKTCSTESLVKKYGYHVPLRGDLLNSNCRPMSAMPRKQQPPIALANAATLPLPLPSLRMEPPSNQNNSNSYDLLSYWKEERKSSGDSSSSQGQPFYFFLPIGPTSSETTSNETRVEAEDDIDLNLKL
ncbi:hypothetical protein Cni_G17853 [Canna indica]|uniref:Uncharacterized protein n=1 Tax=Canna indica TaxID=4628 RepID=A0AAQ3KHY9_9LILI|nr:hypothetical protein Cni_G17853 [Canna indica]